VLLLGIIGTVSYFLIKENTQDTAETNTANTSEVSNQTDDLDTEDSTDTLVPDGFTEYSRDGFSFYYPSDWGDPNVVETPVSEFIGERFYNQNVAYNLEGNYWEYIEDQGFDGEGYAGDVPVLRKSKDITVWGFGFGDAGCGKSDPTYLVADKMIQITMPIVCAYEDSVSGTFVEGEVEVNLSQDKKINMTQVDYETAVDTILDRIVLSAAGEI
jgi:hypothetical protein